MIGSESASKAIGGDRPEPSVTVVVISYNHDRFVSECLDSVADQTGVHYELVILDDASTDGSADAIRVWNARHGSTATLMLRHKNRGLCRNLNDVLEGCSTPFVCFISADDLMEPDRLRIQVDALRSAGAEYAMCYSDMYLVSEQGERTDRFYLSIFGPGCDGSEPPSGDVYHSQLRRNLIATPSVLLRTDAVRQVGGYDETLEFEDYDMWLRLASQFKVLYIHRPLVSYRQVETSLSRRLQAEPTSYYRQMIRILIKHEGRDEATDRVLADQLGSCAKELYLNGGASPEVASALRFAARYDRLTSTRLYLLANWMRLPASLLVWARGRAVRARRGK